MSVTRAPRGRLTQAANRSPRHSGACMRPTSHPARKPALVSGARQRSCGPCDRSWMSPGHRPTGSPERTRSGMNRAADERAVSCSGTVRACSELSMVGARGTGPARLRGASTKAAVTTTTRCCRYERCICKQRDTQRLSPPRLPASRRMLRVNHAWPASWPSRRRQTPPEPNGFAKIFAGCRPAATAGVLNTFAPAIACDKFVYRTLFACPT